MPVATSSQATTYLRSRPMTIAADERLARALRSAGHRVTSQRLVLHRVLTELGRHATAE
jgi:Fe2+ or Zn2+ uptake regulation protein